MVFNCEVGFGFRLRITPTSAAHGKEANLARFGVFWKPHRGVKVFQVPTSNYTGKILITELSLGVFYDLDLALCPEKAEKENILGVKGATSPGSETMFWGC